MKKRLFSLVLIIAMLVSLFPAVTLTAAAASAPAEMWIAPSETNGIPAQIDVFKHRIKTGGSYWNPTYTVYYELYLPGNVKAENCFLSWDGDTQAVVDGVAYNNGSCPVPSVNIEKTVSFINGNQTLAEFKFITYQGSADVEPVFIEVDESDGNPTIAEMDSDINHNVTCSGNIYIGGEWKVMSKIKGRGNATWTSSDDKKPYNITLDSKINFPGIDSDKTKKWSFLAEALDRSLLCNRSGFYLAHELGIGQDTASADVWMNGEYQGCYMVTPKTDSFVTKDGFMVEQDNYKEESVEDGGDPQFTLDGLITTVSGWSSSYNYITVKKIGDNLLKNEAGEVDESPENMKAAAAEIQSWLQDAWDAIRSDTGYNSKGKYYTDYIDIESFAKMYLMHEYVKSYDVCAGSILFHRDGQTDADKLIAGPLWDLDNAMGAVFQNSSLGKADDRRNGDRRSAEGDFIKNVTEYKTSIYKTISKHSDFGAEVSRQYNKYKWAFDKLEDDTVQMMNVIEDSALMNHKKVNDLGTGTGKNNHYYGGNTTLGSGNYQQKFVATSKWADYAANLKTYITVRSLWFADHYYDPSYVDPSTCEHQYEQVVSPATCVADGSITYTCPICGDHYTESIPKIAHNYQDGFCTMCGQKLLNVNINCDAGASVTVYETKDYNGAYMENAESTHPRSGDTGLIDCSGDGQVNFAVSIKPGYVLDSVSAEPAESFKNLKLPEETGIENGYRLTKVKGDVTLNVTVKKVNYTINVDNSTGGTVSADLAAAAAGDTVTLTVTPDPDFVLESLTVIDSSHKEVAVDKNNQFIMPESDVTVNAAFLQTRPKVEKHSLLLSSEIGVRFRVSFPETFDSEGCVMKFSLTDGRTESMSFEDAEKIEGTNDRCFTCFINVLELAETITAVLQYGDGKTVTDTYSAMTYIKYVQENMSGDTKLLNLVNALQNYGYYMQGSGWTDKKSHTNIPVNASLNNDSITAAQTGVKDMAIVKSLEGSGITDVKFALTLNEATVIRISFLPESGTKLLTSGGQERTINGQTYYQFSTKKIGAANLGREYTVSVETDKGTAKVKASAMSYVHAILNNDSFNEEQKYAMTAYYNYYKAADDYQN